MIIDNFALTSDIAQLYTLSTLYTLQTFYFLTFHFTHFFMKIVIAGAGEVGHFVAKMLSSEKYDIVLMDSDESRMEDISSAYDLLTFEGSPTSISDLKKAGVPNADLFVAVTPHESVNVAACMLATNLGAKKTISRIDNREYLLPENADFFKRMGVHSLIYPEMLAAQEIANVLKRGWLREFRTFGEGALVMVCLKVRTNAALVNKKFNSGFFAHSDYRIVAVKRDKNTIIPCGTDEILPNDIVYFVCTPDKLEVVRTQAGKRAFDVKNVIIMGGSRIAINAVRILPKNTNVKIIEANREKCFALTEKLSNTLVINGDCRNVDLLREEGIEDADAFLALTGDSESNVLACLTAKRFGVDKTVAEVENIDYIDFAENLDIGTVINKKLIAASHIYQRMLDEDVLNVTCLTYSDAEVVEFVVKPGDKITRKRVGDLGLPSNVNIGGIIRDGKGSVVAGQTVILPGDHVVVFCMADSVRKIAAFFNN